MFSASKSVKIASQNIQVILTVKRVENNKRVSDEQNTLGPHGQWAYLEQAGVRLLGQISKTYNGKALNGSHLEVEPKLPLEPCRPHRHRPARQVDIIFQIYHLRKDGDILANLV